MNPATAAASKPATAAPLTNALIKSVAAAAVTPAAAPIFAAKKPPVPPPSAQKVSSQVLALKLIASRQQPRKSFDDDALKELAESIKAQDLIQPIVVRALSKPDKNGCQYELVAGERRLRAHQLLGRADIRAEVRDLNEIQVRFAQLAENVQREQLTLTEQCDTMKDLVDEVGLEEAARVMGKSLGWVSKRANAHKLPAEIKKLVTAGKLLDLEIAAGLGELKELGDQAGDQKIRNPYQSLLHDVEDPEQTWGAPVTREAVRDAIRETKEEKASALKEQAEEKLAAERAKKNPKPASGATSDMKRYREKQRKAARVQDDRKNLRNAAQDALYQGLALGKQDRFDKPVDIQYANSFGDYNSVPATSEACDFNFNAKGEIELLKRIAGGFSRKPMVKVEMMMLSLDDAQRVTDALKGAKGLDELELSFEHSINGAELRSSVARLTPAQIKLLPLPRAERDAAKEKSTKKTKTAKTASAGKAPSKPAAKKAAKKKARK